MNESLRNFRTTEPTPSDLEKTEDAQYADIKIYRFVQKGIEIEDISLLEDMVEYVGVDQRIQDAIAKKTPPAKKDIDRKKELHDSLGKVLTAYYKEHRRSILKGSLNLPMRAHERGKDVGVYYYGSVRDFLDNPNTPRYVTKYSHPPKKGVDGVERHAVRKKNIAYLRNKYKLLRLLMNTPETETTPKKEHIPKAWFVMGEFRERISRSGGGKFETTLRAITIQREIRGKTFDKMTNEEKNRVVVQNALKDAMETYKKVQKILHDACIACEVDPKEFEMGLDIGSASPGNRDEVYNPETFSSPNVMYDEEKKSVFFIDMGWGEWTKNKEKVFRYILKNHKLGQIVLNKLQTKKKTK